MVSLAPEQLLVLGTAGVPGLSGQSGPLTLSHDGPYGGLAGKTVALEPATGFSFDSHGGTTAMRRTAAFATILAGLAGALTAQPLGTAFTYQGRLTDGGNPASGSYDLQLALFDAAAGGAQVGPLTTRDDVVVTNGLFTVSLDFGAVFTGTKRWLEVRVRPSASTGAYTTLSPRQELTPSPGAVFGASVPWAGVSAKPPGFADDVDNDSGGDITAVTAGTGLTGGGTSGGVGLAVDSLLVQSRVSGTCPAGSSIRVVDQAGTVSCETDDIGWGLTGNAGTNPATNFIGTTDNRPFELRTNNLRVLRFVQTDFGSVAGPSVVQGYEGNAVDSLVTGAMVAGGGRFGSVDASNQVTGNFGTVAGGYGNRAGGSFPDQVFNIAGATVGGGANNAARRAFATVPGGYGNLAGGSYSFAAGYGAGIRDNTQSGDIDGDEGTFVWSDSQGGFTSTGPNQFLIRASGGVGINTNAPLAALQVLGRNTTEGTALFTPDPGKGSAMSHVHWGPNGDWYIRSANASGNVVVQDSGGNVGIGTSAPAVKLHVVGDAIVAGTLSKGGGSFKIDHPLDPENRYLYHSFVESPYMMNVYNGNVTTDGEGYATVELPDWFEALNRDFRYQLTVLDEADEGGFAQVKVVRRVTGNRFTIRTNAPGTDVSWQVTGIRKDAFAERHRIPVEEDKAPEERGTYLYPEEQGRPRELGLDYRPPRPATDGGPVR